MDRTSDVAAAAADAVATLVAHRATGRVSAAHFPARRPALADIPRSPSTPSERRPWRTTTAATTKTPNFIYFGRSEEDFQESRYREYDDCEGVCLRRLLTAYDAADCRARLRAKRYRLLA